MELQGLYELHDRLTAAAVVGASLAAEDFRLKRAVEQIRPMAEAVSVIKKLYLMTEKVLSPDCEDRAGCLLDTLALSKAILCTQAGVGGEADAEYCEPELAPRSHGPCRPYSQVVPLENAMTRKGGGERRLDTLKDAMSKRPELIDDYRLQAALVLALSDKFSPIAETAGMILAREEPGKGAGILHDAVVSALSDRYSNSMEGAKRFLDRDRTLLPLLKKGFWETTEMGRVRRLRVIEALAGGKENDFYLALLDRSRKKLREEAIRALQFEASNAGVLLELTKTEKSDCLAMTERVLGIMGGEAVTEYWKTQLKKRPKESMDYIRFSKSDGVSDTIAGLINDAASAVPASKKDQRNKAKTDAQKEWESWMNTLISATPGKGSGAMQEIYRSTANGNIFFCKMQNRMIEALVESIIYSVDERLIALAYELADHFGGSWIVPALAADFLTQPAEKVYERCRDELSKASLLGTDKQRRVRKSVLAALVRINAVTEGDSHQLVCWIKEQEDCWWGHKIGRQLKEMLDPRWFDLLMDETVFGNETVMVDPRWFDLLMAETVFGKGSVIGGGSNSGMCRDLNRDQVLFSLIPIKLREKMEPYFRRRAMQVKDNRAYYPILKLCGSSDFSGLAVEFVRKNADMGISLDFLHEHFGIRCWGCRLPQEIREIDQFLCGFPKDSPQRKNWDSSDHERSIINIYTRIDSD